MASFVMFFGCFLNQPLNQTIAITMIIIVKTLISTVLFLQNTKNHILSRAPGSTSFRRARGYEGLVLVGDLLCGHLLRRLDRNAGGCSAFFFRLGFKGFKDFKN